jgi:glycerol-3-phosphate dehydrogenase subunit B
MRDLVVIGAGLCGLSAAYAAANAGLEVRVVAKGMGASHWTAGTVDVLGYYPPGNQWPVKWPLESVSQLVEQKPGHPYSLLESEQLRNLLSEFAALTHEIGLPYAGAREPGRNLLLPSPLGVPRPAYLAPQAQMAGDLVRSDPMVIVGFQGMRDFFPKLIAANLTKLRQKARSAFLSLSLLTERRDINTVQMAKLLDEPERRTRLAGELRKLVAPGERIGLPAILGFADHTAALTDLQERAGAQIFEIPTLPPSVPGIRLHTALRNRLAQMGVQVEIGMEVIGYQASGERISWVQTETSSRPLKHRSECFLLATGGVLGGGFNSDRTGRLWETIFDLPVTVPQNRSQWFRPAFLDPAGQPVFQGGVAVGRNLQPVHSNGTPVFANLWAAGSALAQADAIHERSLEGIAIATGMAAARGVVEGRKAVQEIAMPGRDPS